MEYAQLVALSRREFDAEERDISQKQFGLDAAQALLDRRRKALAKKRRGFERMMAGWQTRDEEVVSGKPATAEEPAEPREPGSEAAA